MNTLKRRDLIKSILAASAVGAAPFNILKAGPSANSKLNIACIGIGRQGAGNASALARLGNIVALCDVDHELAEKQIARRKELQKAKLWTDYRKMFDKVGKQIDAVCIATPDHNHFAISMHAMRNGKHVYCQKPLCHTVNEVRLLTEEAKKLKVVTQMGHQGHSSGSSAMIKDWGLADSIGPIRQVDAYSRKNYWTDKPIAKNSITPKTLNWDLFLNRAENIPFSSSYMNREWIRYRHFSGPVGDMAGHIFDAAYYALELGAPLSVRAEVQTPPTPWSTPRGGVITWKFAARGKKPAVTMRYFLGVGLDFPHPKHLDKKARGITSGSVLIGQNASIMVGSHSQGARIIPDAAMKDTPKPPAAAFRCKGKNHFQNWTLACKGDDKAMSSFDYAGPLSEIIVLGDVALLHPGVTLDWDSKNMKITNHQAANACAFMKRLAPRDDMNWC